MPTPCSPTIRSERGGWCCSASTICSTSSARSPTSSVSGRSNGAAQSLPMRPRNSVSTAVARQRSKPSLRSAPSRSSCSAMKCLTSWHDVAGHRCEGRRPHLLVLAASGDEAGELVRVDVVADGERAGDHGGVGLLEDERVEQRLERRGAALERGERPVRDRRRRVVAHAQGGDPERRLHDARARARERPGHGDGDARARERLHDLGDARVVEDREALVEALLAHQLGGERAGRGGDVLVVDGRARSVGGAIGDGALAGAPRAAWPAGPAAAAARRVRLRRRARGRYEHAAIGPG